MVLNASRPNEYERFLTAEGYPHVERDITYLRRVQELRSRVSAHLKGSDYQKMLTKNLGTDRGIEAIQVLLKEGLTFLTDLATWVTPPVGQAEEREEADGASDQEE